MLKLKYKICENILRIFNLNSLCNNYLQKNLKKTIIHNNR